ncbi:hypothetical protein G7Y89_g5864 [Cudoniella acicularis]|uniref:Uncharacterized protein n=1 Tax=Cudoniella acicularis TaxID=354080 RepID=A0A8H4W307_9HELO|nr:hypothetical protein G7Y89_g5864 [Cudoniella acicularis]
MLVRLLRNGEPSGMATPFKTYPLDPSLEDCKIWEGGRAVSAFQGLFEPERCGIAQVKFVTASSMHGDPSMRLVSEASKAFPGRSVGCVLTVGTGSRKMNRPSKTYASNATPPTRLRDEITGKDHKSFRFDESITLPDIGFSDITKWAACRAHTIAYMEANRIDVDACSLVFSETPQNVVLGSKDTFHLPYPLRLEHGFLGRQDIFVTSRRQISVPPRSYTRRP